MSVKIVKKKKKSMVQTKAKISSGLFLAPSFLGVLLFFVVPFLVVIFYSMVDNPISHNFVFLDNFIVYFWELIKKIILKILKIAKIF